ncbi:tetratricopeptide repeat protein [Ponticaulis koreensis]|uniref:tetratricopeptide repeat protein n=1 Tax=Ponticaulis koreensis TaxID=1123045 RepID=UPI0003B6898A|nr:tetratricopeptide repeat protein [Ponticaulis koreensis]
MGRIEQSEMKSLRGKIRDGAFISALELCQKLLQHDQNNPYLWLACSEVLENLERFDDALDSLSRAKRLNGDAVTVTDREILLARAMKDDAAELAALIRKGFLSDQPNLKHWYWMRVSTLAWRTGERPIALKALSEAFARYHACEESRHEGKQAVLNVQPSLLAELLPSVARQYHDCAFLYETLFYARMLEGQSSLAINAFLEARKIAPENRLSKPFLERFKREEIDWDVFEILALDYVTEGTACAELIWLLVWYRQYSGRVPDAVALLKDNIDLLRSEPLPLFMAALDFASSAGISLKQTKNEKISPMAAFQRAVNEDRWHDAIAYTDNEDLKSFVRQALPLLDSGKARLSHPALEEEVIVSGPERPNGIVFIFTGLADALIVPINLIDVFLAELGLTAVYCRDFQRMIGCNGIKSLGNDFDETIDGFKSLIAQYGENKPVFTMGNSAGGYLAGIYGAKIGAKASLLFSPVYSVDAEELLDRFQDKRARVVIRRINKSCDLSRLRMSDAMEEMGDSPVTAYVPTGDNEDARHAQGFASHSNVTIHELDNFTGHGAITRAAGQRGFLNIVKDAYGL